LDIDVTSEPGESAWLLTDLLGREMGRVVEEPAGAFRIHPAGHAVQTMATMKLEPYRTLDEALAEIERFTRGTCRRAHSRDRGDEASS
jgi:hypothetical protein